MRFDFFFSFFGAILQFWWTFPICIQTTFKSWSMEFFFNSYVTYAVRRLSDKAIWLRSTNICEHLQIFVYIVPNVGGTPHSEFIHRLGQRDRCYTKWFHTIMLLVDTPSLFISDWFWHKFTSNDNTLNALEWQYASRISIRDDNSHRSIVT